MILEVSASLCWLIPVQLGNAQAESDHARVTTACGHVQGIKRESSCKLCKCHPAVCCLQESIYALVRALLMDFSLQELRNANLWLGPLFFGSFIILAVFVLLNMFIAIISDAYSEVRRELERAKGVVRGMRPNFSPAQACWPFKASLELVGSS